MRLSQIIGQDVHRQHTDEIIGTCIDALVDTVDNRIDRLLVNTGELTCRKQVLVRVDRVALRSRDATPLIGEPVPDERRPTHGIDVPDMPPTLVGPFGYKITPSLTAADMDDPAMRPPDDLDQRPSLGTETDRFFWFTRLWGADVHDGAGDCGALHDIAFEARHWRCILMVCQTADGGFTPHAFHTLRTVSPETSRILVYPAEHAFDPEPCFAGFA